MSGTLQGMSKSQTITQETAGKAPIIRAIDALLALARLLGSQAAREMAVLETIPDKSPNGGSNDQPQACASDDT